MQFQKFLWLIQFLRRSGFLMDGQIRHHVLFTSKHKKSNMTWEGHPGDKDHPKQVLGMLWHVYNDDNLTPFLNR